MTLWYQWLKPAKQLATARNSTVFCFERRLTESSEISQTLKPMAHSVYKHTSCVCPPSFFNGLLLARHPPYWLLRDRSISAAFRLNFMLHHQNLMTLKDHSIFSLHWLDPLSFKTRRQTNEKKTALITSTVNQRLTLQAMTKTPFVRSPSSIFTRFSFYNLIIWDLLADDALSRTTIDFCTPRYANDSFPWPREGRLREGSFSGLDMDTLAFFLFRALHASGDCDHVEHFKRATPVTLLPEWSMDRR